MIWFLILLRRKEASRMVPVMDRTSDRALLGTGLPLSADIESLVGFVNGQIA